MAVAECFRGDGEKLANPIGTIPMIGGRLARASFEPDLMMTDGEAALHSQRGGLRLARRSGAQVPTTRTGSMFDVVWSGRRHVVMGAAPRSTAFGNQNFAAIGTDYSAPKTQLIGFRGAPGNTVNHATSYWVANHSPRVFVEKVDVVTGVGWDRARAARRSAAEAARVLRPATGGDQPRASSTPAAPDHSHEAALERTRA